MNEEREMDVLKKRWPGYSRKDGKIGIRNKVLVIYTVECSSFVAQEITRLSGSRDVDCVGFSGCTDNEYAVRLLIALIRNPNIGAVLAVGLGCEYVQPEWLADIARKVGKEAAWMFIQNEGGSESSIRKGLSIIQTMLKSLETVPMVDMGVEDLIIGAECGGSDYTSGLSGNVVVGRFFDSLVESGGTAIFEEIVEAIGLIDMLKERGVNERVQDELQYTYDKALDYCKSVRQYSVSPGNFAGGLSTIEEKSMGALVKSGTKPIEGVLKVGVPPACSGLWLLDSTPDPYWMQFGITNPNDNEGLMDLISCGCQMVFLVTGRGNVVGSAVAPVIKITGNSDTYRKMEGDMDFNAGQVLDGRCSMEMLTRNLIEMVVDTASGHMTKSERLGHKEYCIPYKYQEKGVAVQRRCDL